MNCAAFAKHLDDPKLEDLRLFLIENANDLTMYQGSSGDFSFPKFDLYARDYLLEAEKELDAYMSGHEQLRDNFHLLNCVSHLKRALDCGLDAFFCVFNIQKDFKKKNLKFEKKIAFLEKSGVFSSRTLVRLNTIRNRMDHDYEIPKLRDMEIEVYFDLVVAFVSVLERSTTFATQANGYFAILDDQENPIGGVAFEYNTDKPSIQVEWGKAGYSIIIAQTMPKSVEYDLKYPEKFAFLFKILMLLPQLDQFVSTRYVTRFLEL